MPPQSLRSRLLLAFLGPTGLLFGAMGALGYELSSRVLEDELGRSLSAIAGSAASQVAPERLLAIEPGDDTRQTRTWRNSLRALSEVRQGTGVRRVFAVDRAGQLRVDAGGELPVGSRMPELARDRLEWARVLAGEKAASQVLFEGSDGRWYKTGYAPLMQDGKVVGAIGVEGSAAFFGPLRQLGKGFAFLTACALVALGAVALITARGLTAPLKRLMRAALRIGRGDLGTPVAPEPTLEVGTLAQELETMRRALESRDRQLTMMLAGVAHEVRNPIGGMELFAGLLSEELSAEPPAAPEVLRSRLERIRAELDYLKHIVEDFLSFARDHKLTVAPLAAAELLAEAEARIGPDALSKQVKLSTSAEPAPLEGDHSLLISALVNVLKNAVQASPEGGTVELLGRPVEGGYRIEVKNRGAAIPPEVREKIFEPFFTTRQRGTGLGLPLARKILQAHRGEIALHCSPGLTTFTLTLPSPGSRSTVAGMTDALPVLWFNPQCSKCRGALELLRARQIEPALRRYLESPPTRTELNRLVAKLKQPAHALVRSGEKEYQAMGLSPQSTEDQLLDAVAQQPRLLERPILELGDRAVIGRPPERVLELLPPGGS